MNWVNLEFAIAWTLHRNTAEANNAENQAAARRIAPSVSVRLHPVSLASGTLDLPFFFIDECPPGLESLELAITQGKIGVRAQGMIRNGTLQKTSQLQVDQLEGYRIALDNRGLMLCRHGVWDVAGTRAFERQATQYRNVEVEKMSLESVLPGRARSTGAGRKPTLDLEALKATFELEVKNKGWPDPENVSGWQSQADIARWVADWATARQTPVGESAAKRYASNLLKNNEN